MKEIELKVTRQIRTKNSTIGELTIDGKHFSYTLEDFDRDANKDGDLDDIGETKVYGETAIPKGKYEVILSYSPHFKRITPEIIGVKGFSSIRIHPGNTKKDTLGCILVGEIKNVDEIKNSKIAFEKLMLLLNGKDKITIIID